MASKKPHVGIVGAGISGLRCAEILLEHGFQVTILEARDRIGGRICQSDKLGYRADIGPNWIHTYDTGGRHPILELANKTNTPLHHWNSKQNIYDSSGRLLPDEKSDKMSTLLWEIIEEGFEYSAKLGKAIPEGDSFYDFFKVKAKERFPDQKGDEELLLQMSEVWGAYVGDPVTRQSLRFAYLEECCGGEEMFVESTYEAIFAEIARLPREKATIRLNERVTTVKTTGRDVEDSQVVLKTKNGESLAFDEVLMTTPLGWLKRNKDTVFQPALPERMSAGIDGISVGHLEKVYITFPEAFWVDPPAETPDASLSPVERATALDTFPSYTNWLAPNYAPDTNPKRWGQEIWNLASFTPPNVHPTILFYLYGDLSAYITSLVHKKTDQEHYKLLNEFFQPYYSLLPRFSAEDPVCKPKAFLSTEWQKDELSGYGSYCNIQIGAKDADGDINAMRHGVPERRLWFAGEHTSPFEELGTVAGAYLSGEGIALRILDTYGIPKPEFKTEKGHAV